ncbi:hypothetical protein GCM10023195_43650 [Actinoallomurus liliacearum]|uniref:Uncharacterized protein n=1 Tax=Actinoallomurus liliacearum TaxID=1080073 RepID=A0ABP8TNK7_9ACTN
MALVRAALALGAMAALTAAPVQTAHAAPRPATSTPAGKARDLKSPIVAGKPMRKPVPLGSRRFAGPTATVKVDLLDRKGAAPSTDDAPFVAFMALGGGDSYSATPVDGHVEGTLPTGDYAVYTRVQTAGDTGGTSTTLVYLSKVSVTEDTSLTLDARKGRPVTASSDRADARMTNLTVQLTQNLGDGPETVALDGGTNFYITPAGTDGALTYHLQAQLTRNGAETGSPYVYDLATSAPGIPANPALRTRTSALAAVRTPYLAEGGPACGGTHAGANWGGVVYMPWTELGALPVTRTEYFTPGVDWRVDEDVTGADCGFAFDDTDVRYRTVNFPSAGSYTRGWSAAPLGPSVGKIYWSTNGPGGEPALIMSMLSSADAKSQLGPYAHMTGTSTLRDAAGNVVATSDEPGTAQDWAAPAPGRYTLTIDAERAAPWSDLATRQHDVWNLTVGTGPQVALPALRYRMPLDANSRGAAGADQSVSVVPDGTDGTPTLRVSYDDGATWSDVALHTDGSVWTGVVHNPSSGYVSLRGAVAGVVDQTLIRAYGVR